MTLVIFRKLILQVWVSRWAGDCERIDHTCSLAGDTAGSIFEIQHGAEISWEGAYGRFCRGKGLSISGEKRPPAEGSRARLPVILGSRERSWRLWMWDLSSVLTWAHPQQFLLILLTKTGRHKQVWANYTFLIIKICVGRKPLEVDAPKCRVPNFNE